MNKKNKIKAIVAIAVAMAFVMPVAAVANFETIGVISDSEITGDIKSSDNTESTLDSITEDTIEVDDDNPDPDWYDATHVRTITEGVTNATAGWTVYVYNGIYYEYVQVTKQLDFVGESRENVVLDTTPPGYTAITMNSQNNISIDSFTITNAYYGISTQSLSGINITNCDIHDCSSYGIRIFTTSYVNVTNCILYGNSYGFRSDRSSNINIANCDAYYNDVDGISIQNNHVSGSITDCNLYDNYRGITLYASANITVINCNVSGSTREGILVDRSPYDPSEYITITGCNVYNNAKDGIYARTDDSEISYCNVYGNTLDGIHVVGYARHNIITNCDVYNNDGAGICLDGQSVENNIIANCNVHDNNVFETDLFSINAGIHLNGGNNNEVTNCIVSNNNGMGIFLVSSQECTLIDNTISNDDFLVFGLAIEDYLHDIGTSNTINGEPIFYLIGEDGDELNETHNFGFLALIGCTNMIVKNSEVYGMVLFGTGTSTISNVDCHGGFAGPLILGSLYNNFIDCDIYNSVYGLTFLQSFYNTVTNCNVHDNMLYGITIGMGSTENDVSNCNVYNNALAGIAIETSTASEISSCDVYNNYAGIYLMGSPSNLIYNNYVVDNTLNAFDDVSAGTNTWNIAKTAGTNIIGGPFLGGNFWSNYAGEDLDGDGLGDTLLPYNCGGMIQGGGDSLPLVPVPVVDAIVSITPSTQTVNKGDTFTFSVYVEPGDTPIMGIGFRTLFFNQTLIYVDSIAKGDIVDPNTWFTFIFGDIDNTLGEIGDTMGAVLPADAITTPGSFLVVTCHALQELGTSDLVLFEVDVCDVNNDPILTVVNNGDVIVEAIYYTLDITIAGSGTVNCDPVGDPPGTYEEGTVVTLTPEPVTEWIFDGWSGPDAGDLVPVHDYTMFKNYVDSSAVILVRSLISSVNTFYEVPPGEYIIFFSDGSFSGSSEFDSFEAEDYVSSTTVTYTVTEVSNCSSGPSENGPWTPIEVGDTLTTCTWYKRDVMTCSSLKVQDQNGNNLSMPHTDIIYIIVAHHVPNDPRFENVNGYKDYADFNYAVFDTTSDYCIVSGNTLVKPGAQIGLSSQFAEAFIPQRDGETAEGVFEVCNIGDPSSPDRWATTMDGNKQVTATFIFGDEEPPVITEVTIATSDPLDTIIGWERVTCTVTDNIAVQDVTLVVTYLDTTPVEYTMTETGIDTYSCEITLTDVGDYTYHIWADDTSDNIAESIPKEFVLPPNWDVVNLEDRECHFYDLMAIVSMYGTVGPYNGWVREDVDNDGEVHFYDLMAIVSHYGDTW